jgi:uncharacterized protein YyaL (SSP411 family)
VLQEPLYRAAAEGAARQILHGGGRDERGRLLHRCRRGKWDIPAFLDDYAYLAWGLLELYGATWNPEWLGDARQLVRVAGEMFRDADGDGFFFTAHDQGEGLARHKPTDDGATPSGNAVMMQNLLWLSRLLADAELEAQAASISSLLASEARGMAWGHTQYLTALDLALGPAAEVVVAGGGPEAEAMLDALVGPYQPRLSVLRAPAGDAGAAALRRLREIAPWIASLPEAAAGGGDGPATAYVCSGGRCQLPVHSPAELAKALASALAAEAGSDADHARSPGTAL